ncbi:hypothetical protein AbaMCR8683_06825 [Acinetobacter baumannii]|uniref:hypothetical protein n=1 Tax=Acinetobacter baumannii TaxID=470 RepID=UPI000CE4FEEB|nr:hypothetical protein [Acinetobacter baumannii]PPC57155.1 hypothetical protein AbaMCR8683_06825 [Acinetobacter baumannii]
MDNYKIKVKDEAESKEAQELFVQLGYELFKSKRIGIVATEDNGTVYPDVIGNWDAYEGKELTLPQLRDLVVLKRNDVKDANHHAERGGEYFITSDGDIYFWMCKWVKSTLGSAESLTATETSQPQDPALISGAEAKLAWAKGEIVEYFSKSRDEWFEVKGNTFVSVFDSAEKLRIKPQTIKVELELPKPFEPKVGDIYWFLSPFYSTGYDHCTFTNDSADKLHVQYGAYRTEEEIKQVVEQLRKIRGAS